MAFIRYTMLIGSIYLFSCQSNQKQEISDSMVIPRLQILTDTIDNGGILEFKGYLQFKPALSSEQIEQFISEWDLSYDSIGYVDARFYRQELWANAKQKGDTSFGKFKVFYPTTDTLPEFFEHSWTAAFKVKFILESGESVDTTYVDKLGVIVRK